MHTDAERLRRRKLRADQIARARREHIVVVEARRATVLDEFPHAAKRAIVDGVGIEPGPDAVQRGQPVEQGQPLHRRQIAREILVQVMVRVDQAGVQNELLRVDHLVGFDIQLAERANLTPLHEQVGAAQHRIGVVAGDDGARIFE